MSEDPSTNQQANLENLSSSIISNKSDDYDQALLIPTSTVSSTDQGTSSSLPSSLIQLGSSETTSSAEKKEDLGETFASIDDSINITLNAKGLIRLLDLLCEATTMDNIVNKAKSSVNRREFNSKHKFLNEVVRSWGITSLDQIIFKGKSVVALNIKETHPVQLSSTSTSPQQQTPSSPPTTTSHTCVCSHHNQPNKSKNLTPSTISTSTHDMTTNGNKPSTQDSSHSIKTSYAKIATPRFLPVETKPTKVTARAFSTAKLHQRFYRDRAVVDSIKIFNALPQEFKNCSPIVQQTGPQQVTLFFHKEVDESIKKAKEISLDNMVIPLYPVGQTKISFTDVLLVGLTEELTKDFKEAGFPIVEGSMFTSPMTGYTYFYIEATGKSDQKLDEFICKFNEDYKVNLKRESRASTSAALQTPPSSPTKVSPNPGSLNSNKTVVTLQQSPSNSIALTDSGTNKRFEEIREILLEYEPKANGLVLSLSQPSDETKAADIYCRVCRSHRHSLFACRKTTTCDKSKTRCQEDHKHGDCPNKSKGDLQAWFRYMVNKSNWVVNSIKKHYGRLRQKQTDLTTNSSSSPSFATEPSQTPNTIQTLSLQRKESESSKLNSSPLGEPMEHSPPDATSENSSEENPGTSSNSAPSPPAEEPISDSALSHSGNNSPPFSN